MNHKFFLLFLFMLLIFSPACQPAGTVSSPPPASDTVLDAVSDTASNTVSNTVPVTTLTRAFTPAATCAEQFIPHTLPFATGTRLREINTYESNGAGLAVNDLDDDGDLDLVFASIDSESTILWNEGGLKFTPEPLADRFTRSVAIVDVDGDGALDIVFTHRGLQSLSYWRNQGATAKPRFAQAPLQGVDSYGYAMAWADMTGDGRLDLVSGAYNIELQEHGLANPEADARAGIMLYEAQVTGFVAKPLSPTSHALAIALVDLNGDRQRDIWVANDFDLQDRIWFRQPGAWEPAKPFEQTSYSTMSIDWGDITNVGMWAFYTTDMNPYDTSTQTLATWLPVIAKLEINHKHEWGDPQVMANTLQIASAGNIWRDQGNARGVDATGWSWSSKFGDLDGDGYLDLYIVNGMIAQNLFKHLPYGELVEENRAFRNRGDGTFQLMTSWQLGATASGRGMTMADLDNDGDLDIVVNNLRQSAQLFENSLCGGSGLQVALQWPATPNPYGVGAELHLHTSRGVFLRDVRVTSGYLSGDPVRVHFGFPQDTTIEALDIRWPDGAHSRVATPPAGHLLEVTR